MQRKLSFKPVSGDGSKSSPPIRALKTPRTITPIYSLPKANSLSAAIYDADMAARKAKSHLCGIDIASGRDRTDYIEIDHNGNIHYTSPAAEYEDYQYEQNENEPDQFSDEDPPSTTVGLASLARMREALRRQPQEQTAQRMADEIAANIAESIRLAPTPVFTIDTRHITANTITRDQIAASSICARDIAGPQMIDGIPVGGRSVLRTGNPADARNNGIYTQSEGRAIHPARVPTMNTTFFERDGKQFMRTDYDDGRSFEYELKR